MFVLRRLTSQNAEVNTVLGDSYNLVDSERNPEDFEKSLEILKCDRNDVYAFIIYRNGSETLPLYKKSVYFIMMSNGQTFSNITHK